MNIDLSQRDGSGPRISCWAWSDQIVSGRAILWLKERNHA